MARYIINDWQIKEICDAIRVKTGRTEPIPFVNIVSEILSISANIISWIYDGSWIQGDVSNYNISYLDETCPHCGTKLYVTDAHVVPGVMRSTCPNCHEDIEIVDGRITYESGDDKTYLTLNNGTKVRNLYASEIDGQMASMEVGSTYCLETDGIVRGSATVISQEEATATGEPMWSVSDYVYLDPIDGGTLYVDLSTGFNTYSIYEVVP